jgi:Protein of unknown function (DUF3396)
MDWSKLTLKEGNKVIAVPCLEVVAFSYAPPAASGPGFKRFLETFAGRFGNRLKFYRTGDMKQFRPFEQKALDAPYHWFSDSKVLATNMLGFQAHAGDSGRQVYPPSIKITLWGFAEQPHFAFRMGLPVEMGEDPDKLISLVQEALADFPIENGHCGYSFVWDNTSVDKEVSSWAAPLLLRHPGLGNGNPVKIWNAANQGVATVSWLTLLGPRLTTDLGGRATLEGKCPPEVLILPLGRGGILLRAGLGPELGDVNRRDILPTYRAVGKLVALRRAPDDAFNNLRIPGMSKEDANDWLRRFFV